MAFDLTKGAAASVAQAVVDADEDVDRETNVLRRLLAQADALTLPASFVAGLKRAADVNAKLRADLDTLLQEGRPTRMLLLSQQQQMKRLRAMLSKATEREHALQEENDDCAAQVEQLQEELQQSQAAVAEREGQLRAERVELHAARRERKGLLEKDEDIKRLMESRREAAAKPAAANGQGGRGRPVVVLGCWPAVGTLRRRAGPCSRRSREVRGEVTRSRTATPPVPGGAVHTAGCSGVGWEPARAKGRPAGRRGISDTPSKQAGVVAERWAAACGQLASTVNGSTPCDGLWLGEQPMMALHDVQSLWPVVGAAGREF